MDRPFMIGPHYPLIFMSSTFEPDTAYTLREGSYFLQTSYTKLNTYVFSNNSNMKDNPTGDPSLFGPTESKGYSVYFDGEIDRRLLRLHYGLTNDFELQFTYREIMIGPGNLDTMIEDFHTGLGLGNQGRDQTDRHLLEIFIYDNLTGEVVWKITLPTSGFVQESMTLGFKWQLKRTAKEAIALNVSSNFNNYNIEHGLNEVDQTTEHKNFNDSVASLLYTSRFERTSLYAAVSLAKVSKSLLARSPDELYYFFLGSNYHYSERLDFLIQLLEYSSPFPKESSSAISADIREITMGVRWNITKSLSLETGLIENQSQGPQNIDIAFFSNLMTTF